MIKKSKSCSGIGEVFARGFAAASLTLALMTVSPTVFAQSFSLMPVGDSITEGYTACSYREPLIDALGNCSVDLVGSDNAPRNLPAGLSCTYNDNDHEGHSGYSTGDFMVTTQFNGVSRIRHWASLYTPDVVLLHIGSNDMAKSSGVVVGTYNSSTNTGTGSIGRISLMVDEIYAENANANIFVADLIPWFGSPSTANPNINLLRPLIATMVADRASDGDDIKLVDVSTGFQSSMMVSDLIHPNATGETHIASRFLTAMHSDGVCTPTPQIQSPATTTLQGSTQSFTWALNNMSSSRVDNWELWAGSSVNASNYAVSSGTGSATQATLTGLPTNGQTVHVTLRIKYFTGVWFTENKVFTASSVTEFCNGKAVTVYIANGDSPTSNADVIYGTSGVDVINGMGGDDTICGLGGADIINAGNGDDWVDGGSSSDEILGGGGVDTLFGSSGNDDMFGGPGNDFIYGDSGNDTIYGNSGSDFISGGDGVDEIRGGSGNDDIETGSGATVGSGVLVDGGAGNDTILGGPDADEIRGSTDEDTISGGGGDDRLFGGAGEDYILGQAGNDLIRGNSGDDILSGGDGNDDINGYGSKDTITGGSGNDVLDGSTGNDIIQGESGDDTIRGGGGNDQLFGDSGADTIEGGGGNDSLDGGGGSSDSCDGGSGTDTATASCESTSNVP